MPNIASAIESAIARGATPEDVRRRVMGITQRYELSKRCEQAARWLARGK